MRNSKPDFRSPINSRRSFATEGCKSISLSPFLVLRKSGSGYAVPRENDAPVVLELRHSLAKAPAFRCAFNGHFLGAGPFLHESHEKLAREQIQRRGPEGVHKALPHARQSLTVFAIPVLSSLAHCSAAMGRLK